MPHEAIDSSSIEQKQYTDWTDQWHFWQRGKHKASVLPKHSQQGFPSCNKIEANFLEIKGKKRNDRMQFKYLWLWKMENHFCMFDFETSSLMIKLISFSGFLSTVANRYCSLSHAHSSCLTHSNLPTVLWTWGGVISTLQKMMQRSTDQLQSLFLKQYTRLFLTD
jgi:hypothetical protein